MLLSEGGEQRREGIRRALAFIATSRGRKAASIGTSRMPF
jgi:hypothetical protein